MLARAKRLFFWQHMTYDVSEYANNCGTLSISRSTLSLRDPLFQIKRSSARISFFLFFLYNARSFEYFLFLFTNFIIYIKI